MLAKPPLRDSPLTRHTVRFCSRADPPVPYSNRPARILERGLSSVSNIISNPPLPHVAGHVDEHQTFGQRLSPRNFSSRVDAAGRTPKRRRGWQAEACKWVRDGMSLGLGTGSTVSHTVLEIGRMISRAQSRCRGPNQPTTRELAMSVGIPLVTLSEVGTLDLVIDGTMSSIQNSHSSKAEGVLTREKIVAQSSNAAIVVADERKQLTYWGSSTSPWRCCSLSGGHFGLLSDLCP